MTESPNARWRTLLTPNSISALARATVFGMVPMKKVHRDHFVAFEPHTLLKHAILRRYLSTWVEKLLGWDKRKYDRVWFVDGFAGAGQDQQGNPGSPLIAARIARGVHTQRGTSRPPFRVFAVEKELENYDSLVDVVREYSEGPGRVIDVRHGTLVVYLEALTDFVGSDPVLFFLDPFGVDGLRADLVELMLRGPRNEVFALFSDTGASRLLAVLSKEQRDSDAEVKEILMTPSLFAEMDKERVTDVLSQVDRSNQALVGTKPHAERIMTEALGVEGLADLLRASTEHRQAQAARLWREALHSGGATHSVALPIRNAEGGRLHQLVYASKSKTGLKTMKECMSSSLRQSTLPPEVIESMRFDIGLSLDNVLDRMRATFGGSDAKWTGDDGLRDWILTETDALQIHMDEIKETIRVRGWMVSKSPIVVRVPK